MKINISEIRPPVPVLVFGHIYKKISGVFAGNYYIYTVDEHFINLDNGMLWSSQKGFGTHTDGKMFQDVTDQVELTLIKKGE